jgi:hypothetical protein
MPKTISNYGSISEVVASGLTSPVTWSNPNNGLANDGSYTTASFSVGNVNSNFLYIHGFSLNVPASAVIEGITVSIKKQGVGPVTDTEVYLAYNDGGEIALSPTNFAAVGNWSGVAQVKLYGGSTNLWGLTWTPDDINHSDFGLAIDCTGDGSASNQARIDSIQITITYHDVYSNVGSGGGFVAGRASSSDKPVIASAGVLAAGHAAFTDTYTNINNGVTCAVLGGTAFVLAGWPMGQGGSKASGTATVTCRYNSTQSGVLDYTYDFYCRGENYIPPDTVHDNLGVVRVQLDPILNKLSWNIRHDLTPANSVRFRGPATETQNAAIRVDLSSGDLTSPMIGSTTITNQEIIDIILGLWYLDIQDTATEDFEIDDEDDDPLLNEDDDEIDIEILNQTTRLRGQVMNQNALQADGTAEVYVQRTIIPTSGGLAAGSGTIREIVRPLVVAAGVRLAGTAGNYVDQKINGGAYAGGTATILKLDQPFHSGGVKASGTATVQVAYAHTATGGGVLDGQAVRELTVPVGGGAVLNGAALWVKINIIFPSGGVKIAGTHVLQQTYAPPPIKGGLRVYGSWAAELLHPSNGGDVHRNYALAMKQDNIIKDQAEAKLRGTVIMEPAAMEQPRRKVSRFQIRHQPGWCDFGGKCKDAFLPAIVKVRQKGILPPKDGATVVSDDQLATTS